MYELQVQAQLDAQLTRSFKQFLLLKGIDSLRTHQSSSPVQPGLGALGSVEIVRGLSGRSGDEDDF
jgi:hypothetical protein